jgi:hypothetical protein
MRSSPQQPSHKSHSKAEEEKGHDFGAHEHTLTYQHTHHAASAEGPAEAGESTRGVEVTKLSTNKQHISLRGGRGVHHFTRGACYLELVGPREVIIGQNNNKSAWHWSLPLRYGVRGRSKARGEGQTGREGYGKGGSGQRQTCQGGQSRG